MHLELDDADGSDSSISDGSSDVLISSETGSCMKMARIHMVRMLQHMNKYAPALGFILAVIIAVSQYRIAASIKDLTDEYQKTSIEIKRQSLLSSQEFREFSKDFMLNARKTNSMLFSTGSLTRMRSLVGLAPEGKYALSGVICQLKNSEVNPTKTYFFNPGVSLRSRGAVCGDWTDSRVSGEFSIMTVDQYGHDAGLVLYQHGQSYFRILRYHTDYSGKTLCTFLEQGIIELNYVTKKSYSVPFPICYDLGNPD